MPQRAQQMRRSCFIVLTALALAPVGVLAQSDTPPISSLRVMGEATITVPPDQAQVEIGVVTQAETAEAAAAQNAHKLATILAALRQVLGPEDEIQTVGYALRPHTHAAHEGGPPTMTGYTASTLVQVKTSKLDKLGTLLDRATRSGAHTIQRLVFTLTHDEAVRAQALREAATQAKAKADALVAALNLTMVRVLSVEEGGRGVRPVSAQAARSLEVQAESAPTAIEPDTITMHATVTLLVEVTQER
jgi:uncharacterized protein